MSVKETARNLPADHVRDSEGEELPKVHGIDMPAPTPPNPLTLVMPLQDGADLGHLEQLLVQQQPAVHTALDVVGTVHYARFLIFDASSPHLQPSASSRGPFKLAMITTYDGDFDTCMKVLAEELGEVFDALLQFTTGAHLAPVRDNLLQFADWIAANDASQQPPNNKLAQYAAYPQSVQTIVEECGPEVLL